LRHRLRAAKDRAIRIRPGVTVPGAASWAASGGDSRALGAFTGHESKHAARQHPDVHRHIHDPVEFAGRTLPAERLIGEAFTLHGKVLDSGNRCARLLPWPPPVLCTLRHARPSPSTLAPPIISATSAKPWSALPNLPLCPVGAAWPWGSPR